MSFARKTPRHGVVATNYVGQEAQARLYEVKEAAKQRNRNAIMVNPYPIWYFSKDYHGTATCTCRKDPLVTAGDTTQLVPLAEGATVTQRTTVEVRKRDGVFQTLRYDEVGESVVELDFNTPLNFVPKDADENGNVPDNGTRHNVAQNVTFGADDMPSLMDIGIDQATGTEGKRRPTGAGANCAVCNRTGVVNGYQVWGFTRQVLEFHSLASRGGYGLDREAAPFGFEQEQELPASFWLDVPVYFEAVFYGVYNNIEPLADYALSIGGETLSLPVLRRYRGQRIQLEVQGPRRFTHLQVLFQINTRLLNADWPQRENPHDYGLMITQPQMTVHLTDEAPAPKDGDVIYRVRTGEVFKVKDATYWTIADDDPIGWTVTASIAQPTEDAVAAMLQLYQL